MLNELLTVESNLLLALNHFDVRVDVFIKRVHAYIYMCVFQGLHGILRFLFNVRSRNV